MDLRGKHQHNSEENVSPGGRGFIRTDEISFLVNEKGGGPTTRQQLSQIKEYPTRGGVWCQREGDGCSLLALEKRAGIRRGEAIKRPRRRVSPQQGIKP